MKIYNKNELNNYSLSLTYDDISLVPTEVSKIKSRTDATTNTTFLNKKLSLPILSSPMDTVTGLEMAKELTNLGCMGILNRFDSSLEKLTNGDNNFDGVVSVAIGLNASESLIEKLSERN